MASAWRHYQVQGELWARYNITSAKKNHKNNVSAVIRFFVRFTEHVV